LEEDDKDAEFKRSKNGYVRTLQEMLREKEIKEKTSSRRRSFKIVSPISTEEVAEVC